MAATAAQWLLALIDPGIARPAWTAFVFDHEGFGGAMRNLFEDCWNRAQR